MSTQALQVETSVDEWVPTQEQEDRRTRIFAEYKIMRDVMHANYPEFNDRRLAQFLDDSQKRANGYVQTREAQGKEEWQSNVFTQFTRNKIKAHIASVAKDVPKIAMNAVDQNNNISFLRADTMSNLVRASFVEKGNNPEKLIVNDSWNCAINGTVIKYDGYVMRKEKQKPILSFDIVTGELKLGDEEEVIVEDHYVETNIPVHHLYIRNPYISDIQEQPAIIWRKTYMNKEAFLADWGHYKDAKNVLPVGSFTEDEVRTFFGEHDEDVTAEYKNKIEVIRYYSKLSREYVVYANRVELFSSPLLWGRNKKLYPFSKDIFEQFANGDFFWGNSLPNILMGDQDTANAFLNAMNDKTFRSLKPQRLVDIENRDALELESNYITGDENIYVNKIEGVKPLPQEGVSPSEFQMLSLVSRGIDLASVDAAQQGVGGSGNTAREVVIANQRADELKGLFFVNMKNLWLQKYVLRTQSILIHYKNLKKVEKIVGGKKLQVFENQFMINNVPLSGGETGSLQINVVKNRAALPKQTELDVQEQMFKLQGKNVEVIAITSDFLDEWEYHIQLETESFRTKDRALDMARTKEKLQMVTAVFPERFQANKDEFFKDMMQSYDDDPERYTTEQPALPPEAMGEMGGGGELKAMAAGAMPTEAGALGALR